MASVRNGVTYIQELRDIIRELHGADSTHVESVTSTETLSPAAAVRAAIAQEFKLAEEA